MAELSCGLPPGPDFADLAALAGEPRAVANR